MKVRPEVKGFWAASVSLGPLGKGIDTKKIQAFTEARGNPGLSQVKCFYRFLRVPLFCKVSFLSGMSSGS